MGLLKVKTAIKLFKNYPDIKRKHYWGDHFWSWGNCVGIIGLDENEIRKYENIKKKKKKEKRETNRNLASF